MSLATCLSNPPRKRMKTMKSKAALLLPVLLLIALCGGATGKSSKSKTESSHWGRLYLERGLDSIQYFRAKFGGQPAVGQFPLEIAEPSNGCIPYPSYVIDRIRKERSIMLVRRGLCSFVEKARHAQNAGASAVIMINDDESVQRLPGIQHGDITIAFVVVRKSAGDLLEAAISRSATKGRLVAMQCLPKSPCQPMAEEDQRAISSQIVTGGELHAVRYNQKMQKEIESMEFLTAEFGGPLAFDAVTAVRSEPSDGCSPINNKEDLSNAALIIERGGCSFLTKVSNAQSSGAVLAIVTDNGQGIARMETTHKYEAYNISIPSIMVSESGGKTLLQQRRTQVHFASIDGRVYDLWKTIQFMPENIPKKKKAQQKFLANLFELHMENPDRVKALKDSFLHSGGHEDILRDVLVRQMGKEEL